LTLCFAAKEKVAINFMASSSWRLHHLNSGICVVMSATKMIYLLHDEFVQERALQMSADKQGSQIIEAMTLK